MTVLLSHKLELRNRGEYSPKPQRKNQNKKQTPETGRGIDKQTEQEQRMRDKSANKGQWEKQNVGTIRKCQTPVCVKNVNKLSNSVNKQVNK